MDPTKRNHTPSKLFIWERISIPKYLKLIIKLVISGLALYFVFKKVELREIVAIISEGNPVWLIPAIAMFNISQFISSTRLLGIFKSSDVEISRRENLKLYYIGMFYNLFLPAGIGGDAYKLAFLRANKRGNTRIIFEGLLVDRISGLTVLVWLAMAFFMVGGFVLILGDVWMWIGILLLLVLFPLAFFTVKLIFKIFKIVWTRAIAYSFLIQLAQIGSVYYLLLCLGEANIFNYLIVFLFSSIASVFPFTMGGIGIRELVFIWFSGTVGLQEETGVAIGLLFFIMTSISSLPGAFLQVKPS